MNSLVSWLLEGALAHFQHASAARVARQLAKRCRKSRSLPEPLEQRLTFANFLVVTAADAGDGSLRQAIIDANTAVTDDVITFDTAGVFATPQTISLLTALPQITDAGGALTITGTGATSLTIRRDPGAGSFRVFDSLSPLLIMTGFTVSGGIAVDANGGGLLASNEVMLDRMVFTGNTATGTSVGAGSGAGISLNDDAFLTLRSSTVSGNTAEDCGGGVYFYYSGSLLMENSTISGNTASGAAIDSLGGGGVYFYGTASDTPPAGFTPSALVIRNSTIANNTTPGSGGGILLWSFDGTLLVQNSTISGNSAGATGSGYYYGYGGGGIGQYYSAGTVTVTNSVVSGNTNANAPDILSDGTVDINFSAIGATTGFTPSGTSGNNIAPGTNLMLGALANNGGPTQTMLPAVGSPLIGAGSNALVPGDTPNDQRGPGFARISGGTVDIGAVERDAISPTVQSPQFLFLTAPQSLTFTFSENVSASLGVSDLLLENLSTSTTIPGANIALSYNASTNIATFTFPGYPFGALPDGNYHATLMMSGVTDPSGNLLDDNGELDFVFLAGDANLDGVVNEADLGILALNWQQSPRSFILGNFSYDPFSRVDIDDLLILGRNWRKTLDGSLASGAPMPVFGGMTPARPPSRPPTRAPQRVIDSIAPASQPMVG